MNIKTKALKVLDQFLENIGLMRTATHEEFRVNCEEFAKDYMQGSSGLTVGGVSGRINGGVFSKTVVVCGSNVSIDGSRLEKGMVIAPWVKNFYACGVTAYAVPMKNQRAILNCGPTLDGTILISPDVTFQGDQP